MSYFWIPDAPNVIKSKYTDKRADKASPKLQGWSIEGLTVFDRWCHDIATSRLTKNSDDLENAILKHEKNCLEEERIRSGSVYLLSKWHREQHKRNGENGSCCDVRISWQTWLTAVLYFHKVIEIYNDLGPPVYDTPTSEAVSSGKQVPWLT